MKTAEAIALGFQHYILALGTAVMIPTFLVPLMGGNDVNPLYFINLTNHEVGSAVTVRRFQVFMILVLFCG